MTSALAIFRSARPCTGSAWYALGVLLLLSFLGACSLPTLGKQPASVRQSWQLQDERATVPAPVAGDRPCLTLRVNAAGSAPGFTTERMAYTTQAQRLDYFAYHEWVDTPARMLAALMESRLDASGLFGAVVSGSPEIKTTLRLDAELLRLQQDFTGTGSAVNLAIKVKLIDVPGRALLDVKTFSYSEAAADANPEAGVDAANRAAGRFLAELTTWVAASIDRIDCPPPG